MIFELLLTGLAGSGATPIPPPEREAVPPVPEVSLTWDIAGVNGLQSIFFAKIPDQDLDGKMDVLIGNSMDGGHMEGAAMVFSSKTHELLGYVDAPKEVGTRFGDLSVVGDRNGDKIDDIIIYQGEPSSWHLYSGATLDYEGELPFKGGGYPTTLRERFDLNDDGVNDFRAVGSGETRFYSGKDFSFIRSYPHLLGPAIDDVDGDGRQDFLGLELFKGAQCGEIGVSSGTGKVLFTIDRPSNLLNVGPSFPIEDLDGDGIREFVISWQGTSTGPIYCSGFVGIYSGAKGYKKTELHSLRPGLTRFAQSAIAADLFGDDRRELVVSDGDFLFFYSLPSLELVMTLGSPGSDCIASSMGDDGKEDIAVFPNSAKEGEPRVRLYETFEGRLTASMPAARFSMRGNTPANDQSRTFALRNDSPFTVNRPSDQITVSGAGAKAFRLTGRATKTISPGKSVLYTVEFVPPAPGKYEATVTFNTVENYWPKAEVSLSGEWMPD